MDKDKWEQWAKQWEDKLPNLAKALRNDTLQKEVAETSKEIEALVLHTKIQERALIVYVLESDHIDNGNFRDEWYNAAIRDEIQNHKLAIDEYKEELNKLK